MDGTRFDNLAKKFATRRRVLKGLGAAVAGAGVAATGPGRTLAQGGSECVAFCAQQAGPGSGARFSQCKRACRQCEADVDRICFIEGRFVCCGENQCCGFELGIYETTCCNPASGTCFCFGD